MSKQLNFAQQMDEVLETLGPARPKLLLHACCGPCSSAVLEQLCEHFEITVLYYNPNTWPAAEYHRRGEELERFVAAAHPLGVTVVEDRYDPQEFYSAVAGLEQEPERGSRCTVCYRLRMRRAAQYAQEHGFAWFTTTLSISPHKDARRINEIGQALEAEFGVKHLPPTSKSTTAICAACNYPKSTASTGRTTAAVSSAPEQEASSEQNAKCPMSSSLRCRTRDIFIYISQYTTASSAVNPPREFSLT